MIELGREKDVLLGFVHDGWRVGTAGWFFSVLGVLDEQAKREARGQRRRLTEIHDAAGPYIHDNRSRVARYFLEETDKQWLWFLDNDIEFEPDALDQLLEAAEEHDVRILGAPYPNAYGKSEAYLSWLVFTPDGIKALPESVLEDQTDPVEITAIGMGCTLIHRDVLQDVADMHGGDPWDTFAADILLEFEDGGFLEGRVPEDLEKAMSNGRILRRMSRMGEDVTFPVDPQTPVLRADWRWQPIERFGIGDRVLSFDEYGTPHSSRRYDRAQVTGIVERRLPRLRLITANGEIITTAEHPWLSHHHGHHAWQWTAANELRVGDPMAIVMPQARNPKSESEDYALGYVQGLLHSDGTRSGFQHVVRMKDTEPLERMATMLARLGIESVRGAAHWDGNPRHAPMHRLSVNEMVASSWLEPVWEMTRIPSRDFAAGYLAGMYDGDGSHHGGKLQIHSIRDSYKDRLEEAARYVGVPFTGRGPRSVSMHGQENIFCFWQSTLPSLSRRTFPRGQARTGQEVRHEPATLLAKERLPEADVLCLQTSSSTFIADGYASHNCLRARRAGHLTYGLPTLLVDHFKPTYVSHMAHGRSSAPQLLGSKED